MSRCEDKVDNPVEPGGGWGAARLRQTATNYRLKSGRAGRLLWCIQELPYKVGNLKRLRTRTHMSFIVAHNALKIHDCLLWKNEKRHR